MMHEHGFNLQPQHNQYLPRASDVSKLYGYLMVKNENWVTVFFPGSGASKRTKNVDHYRLPSASDT